MNYGRATDLPIDVGRLDWSRISVDSFSLRAARGDHVGANPVDRAKPGSKLHLGAEDTGLPLSVLVTRADTNDSLVFEALLDDLPAVRTPAGRRRCRPDKCHAAKADDHRRCRAWLAGCPARVPTTHSPHPLFPKPRDDARRAAQPDALAGGGHRPAGATVPHAHLV